MISYPRLSLIRCRASAPATLQSGTHLRFHARLAARACKTCGLPSFLRENETSFRGRHFYFYNFAKVLSKEPQRWVVSYDAVETFDLRSKQRENNFKIVASSIDFLPPSKYGCICANHGPLTTFLYSWCLNDNRNAIPSQSTCFVRNPA